MKATDRTLYEFWIASNISKQVTLVTSQGVHVASNSPGRPILHRVAQIACSRFYWNQLLPAARRSGFILLASAPCHANPVEQIYTRLQLLLADSSLLSLPVGLSLFVPTRAGATGTSRAQRRRRLSSSSSALPCLPLTSVSSSSSSPSLSPSRSRQRQARCGGAPYGRRAGAGGTRGPLPLPCPPHVGSSTPPPARERVLLWLPKP